MANLGLHPELEIDRIDNNRHYAPGNLRWVTDRQQIMNRRNTKMPVSWVFRQAEWPLCRTTVEKKLRAEMTRKQILNEAKARVARRPGHWLRLAAWFASSTF